MESFDFYNPVQLHFGAGEMERLGEEAAELGDHAMLVTGQSSARRTGLLDRAVDLLEDAGMAVTVFDRIMPNPLDSVVDEGGRLARDEGVDVIVGLGGGSAMDASKAIAVAATHDGPIAQYLRVEDKLQPTEATLPIVCVTTTSGTSSELTPFAVITVQEMVQKSAIGNPNIYPRVGIVDPELTLTCPASVTANTGADVLAHSIEGYFSTGASPITDTCAERAIELVGRYLPDAVADGDDLAAREGMSLANVFAGYTLSQCGGTVLHALEHPMSAHYPDLAHGGGLAALMIAWAEMFWEEDPTKFGRMAQLLGHDAAAAPEDAAQGASEAIRGLLEKIGLCIGLEDLGVERDRLEVIVDDALRYMRGAIEKTPADISRDDLMELLERSYSRK